MTHPSRDRMQDIHYVVGALRSGMDDEVANRGQRELVVGGILIALISLSAWAWLIRENASPPVAPKLVQLVVTRAVAGDEADSWIGQALLTSLVTQLEAGSDIRVANSFRQALQMPGNGLPVGFSPRGLAYDIFSSWRLSLSVAAVEESGSLVQVNYTLAGPAEEVFSGQLVGSVASLADLATRASIELRGALSLPLPEPTSIKAALAYLPIDAEATKYWVLGTQALAANRFASAVELLQASAKREANHPMIEQGLAQAYSGLGYEVQARQHAGAAAEFSGALKREQQLYIRAENHAVNKEWEEAGELLRALNLLYPNDTGYGLRLAETQITAGQFSAADETLEQLRSLDVRKAKDPRIDLLAATSDYASGEWAAGLVHAERAVEKAKKANNPDLEALALWWINRFDADPDEVLITRAQLLFEQVGNTDGQIASITRRGTRARARGDLLQAGKYYDSAIKLARETGNESRLSTALGTLAIVKDLQGKLQEGLGLKEEVLQIRRRRGNQTGIGISLENLGISHYKMGNLAAASARFSQANDQFARANDQIGVAWAPWHQGRLLIRYGKAEEALSAFQAAAQNAQGKPEGSYEIHAEFELLQMRLFLNPTQERIGGTVAELEALYARYLAAELLPDAATTLLLLSRFEYLAGDASAAIAHATQAYEVFVSEGAAYYRLNAATQLLRFGEVERCDEVLELSSKSHHRYLALMGLAAASDCPGASTTLTAVRQESTALGLFEPLWLATHQTDPEKARVLAQENNWRLAP